MVHKIKLTLRMLICIEGWEFDFIDFIAIIYFAVNFVHFREFIPDKIDGKFPFKLEITHRS